MAANDVMFSDVEDNDSSKNVSGDVEGSILSELADDALPKANSTMSSDSPVRTKPPTADNTNTTQVANTISTPVAQLTPAARSTPVVTKTGTKKAPRQMRNFTKDGKINITD